MKQWVSTKLVSSMKTAEIACYCAPRDVVQATDPLAERRFDSSDTEGHRLSEYKRGYSAESPNDGREVTA